MRATVVISRGHGEGPQWDMESALAGLCAATPGLKVYVIPHVYHIPEQSDIWKRLGEIRGKCVLASWLFSRPASWVLQSKRIAPDGLRALCLKDYETAREGYQAIVEAIRHWQGDARAVERAPLGAGEESGADWASTLHIEPDPEAEDAGEHGGLEELSVAAGERWYPVIDAERCKSCGQCHQFCLFGVYELDGAGRVRVTHPDNCKPGCPACSRICPAGAIMFPLYAKDEAIAGAPGRIMAPDAAARKMFYTRTKKTCPKCGSTPERGGVGEGVDGVCEECGRTLAAPVAEAKPEARTGGVAAVVRDDIDSLLDDLDQLSQRS